MKKSQIKRAIIWACILAIAYFYINYSWIPGRDAALCQMQLRDYNTFIISMNIHEGCHEAWKSPDETERFIIKHFNHKIPKCPCGGTYSFVYELPLNPHPDIPNLVFSLADSNGHTFDVTERYR
jgi:hypothetical protein